MNNIEFNQKFIFKKEGFFHKYIYKFIDYLNNYNIGNEELLKNKKFTIFLVIKKNLIVKNISLGYISSKNYKTYLHLISFIYESLINIIKINNIIVAEIKELNLYIWEFEEIWNQKLEKMKNQENKKKLKKFHICIQKIINMKFSDSYSTYHLQNLLKELKKYLFLKISLELNQEECIKHLFNLIKSWRGNDKILLEQWIIKTIEKYI